VHARSCHGLVRLALAPLSTRLPVHSAYKQDMARVLDAMLLDLASHVCAMHLEGQIRWTLGEQKVNIMLFYRRGSFMKDMTCKMHRKIRPYYPVAD
jgi:hypothetical protein